MKRANKCGNPVCNRKFGMLVQRRGFTRYCSKKCLHAHTAQVTAEKQRNNSFFMWLMSK